MSGPRALLPAPQARGGTGSPPCVRQPGLAAGYGAGETAVAGRVCAAHGTGPPLQPQGSLRDDCAALGPGASTAPTGRSQGAGGACPRWALS